MIPLTDAALLSHVIVGSAMEQLDMERLIAEVGQAVAERIHGGAESVDDVAKELHEKLLLRQEETKQLVFESIHVSFYYFLSPFEMMLIAILIIHSVIRMKLDIMPKFLFLQLI